MSTMKQVDDLLESYGKELFRSRAEFLLSASENDTPNADTTFITTTRKTGKVCFRRVISLCAAIIIVMLLGLSVCYAFGINPLRYIFTVNNGQIVVTNHNDELGLHFYEPTYVVDGYRLYDVIHISDNNRCYIYESDDSSYIIIERKDNDAVLFVDNANTNMTTLDFDGYEVKVIKSDNTPYIIALLQKDNTRITIQGHLNLEQIKLIIKSLSVKD